MDKKSLFKSKTFWLNLAAGAVAVLLLVDTDLLMAFGISEENQNAVMKIIGFTIATANIYLRLGVTHEVKMPGKIKK